MRRTLRTQLALWNLLIVASALTLFAVLLYAWLANTLYGHHDDEMAEDAGRLAALLNASPEPLRRLAEIDPDRIDPLLIVRDSDGEMVFGSPKLAPREPNIGAHTAFMHAAMQSVTTPQFFTVRLEHTGLVRFICLPLTQPTGTYLQLGRPLGDVDLLLRVVVIASTVLVPVVVALTCFGGLGIARRALAPVDETAAALESIQATDLSRRVEARATDTEVTRLSTSINRLLERLERSFDSMKEFTAEASHQLQTPLTVMKGSIDAATKDGHGSIDYERTLEDLGNEVDILTATLQDLRDYSLAEADSSSRSELVDVSRVFDEAADVVRALAEAHDIRCDAHIASGLAVSGNAVRLRQVVLNLGENAVQFTPAGGHMRIRATNVDHQVLLEVDDTGRGIARDALARVFERGYKGVGPGDRPGSGLGLAIVKRIVDAHGGRVRIESTLGEGTQVTVTLPAASRASP